MKRRGLPRRQPAGTRHHSGQAPPSSHACLTTNEGNRVAVPVQYTPDLDRTFLIPRLTGTQGWTVFEIPSTQGRDFAYRPVVHPWRRRYAASSTRRGSPECQRVRGVVYLLPFLHAACPHNVTRFARKKQQQSRVRLLQLAHQMHPREENV